VRNARGNAGWLMVGLMALSLLGSLLAAEWVAGRERAVMLDFESLYVGSRCLLRGVNPYKEESFLGAVRSEPRGYASGNEEGFLYRKGVSLEINVPTALGAIAPVAAMPWDVARQVWLVASAAALGLGAWLVWGAAEGAVAGGLLLALVLANCELLLGGGNLSAMVLGLTLVGVAWRSSEASGAWNEWIPALALAGGLLLKPQIGWLVWVVLLLAGGAERKRAVRAGWVAVAVGAGLLAWAMWVAPSWWSDLRANLSATLAVDGINRPRTAWKSSLGMHGIISLPSLLCLFVDEPWFYERASAVISAPLVLGSLWWVRKQLKRPATAEERRLRVWVALAGCAALSLLPVYHRLYDVKLMVLAIPACVALGKRREWRGWAALLLTGGVLVASGDVIAQMEYLRFGDLPYDASFGGRWLLRFVVGGQVPLLLLTCWGGAMALLSESGSKTARI